jgi:hypothetical protein
MKIKLRKRTLLPLVAVSTVVVMSLGGFLYSQNLKRHDAGTIQDLATIETALISYRQGDTFPVNLHDLALPELKEGLKNYEYSSLPSEEGSPSATYKICTVFYGQGIKDAYHDEYSSYGGVEGYQHHKKGKQCFYNSYYKGSSHIDPIE